MPGAPGATPGTTEAAALDELLAAIREEIDRHPTWPDLRLKAALLLLETGDAPGAKAELRVALERNPKYVDAHVTLAFAELAAGSYLEAQAAARHALALFPADWRAQVAVGFLHMTAGHLGAALPQLEEATKLAPNRPLPAFALAHALERAKVANAPEAWREASARFPALAAAGRDPALVGNPHRAKLRREAAFHLAQQGDDATARAWLDRALALDLDEAMDAAARAELAFAAGDLAAATGGFRRAIAIEPELVKTRVSLAYALGVTGDLPGAIAELEAAIKLKPKYADLRYQLATLLLDSGNRAGAVSQLEAALGVNPTYAAAHFSLGLLRYGDARWKEAEARFESARKGGFAPEESLAYMGLCAWKLGEQRAAIARFEEAIATDDTHAVPHLGLALARENEGDRAGARAELDRYERLDGPVRVDEAGGEMERLLAEEASALAARLLEAP